MSKHEAVPIWPQGLEPGGRYSTCRACGIVSHARHARGRRSCSLTHMDMEGTAAAERRRARVPTLLAHIAHSSHPAHLGALGARRTHARHRTSALASSPTAPTGECLARLDTCMCMPHACARAPRASHGAMPSPGATPPSPRLTGPLTRFGTVLFNKSSSHHSVGGAYAWGRVLGRRPPWSLEAHRFLAPGLGVLRLLPPTCAFLRAASVKALPFLGAAFFSALPGARRRASRRRKAFCMRMTA